MATPQPQLFGSVMTPDQAAEARALQFAQMSPQQQMQYNIYRNVNRLGRGVAGLLGAEVEDPTMKKASQLRQLASQFDTTTAEGMMQYAQALRSIDPNLAVQAAQQAQAMQETEAGITQKKAAASKLAAEEAKINIAAQREEDFQSALAKLPANASDEDIRKIVMRFGSTDKILAVLSASADREANRQNQLLMARERLDTQLQQARERGATQEMIARMQIEGRQQLATLAAALKADKPVEVDDKAATRIGQNVVFDKLDKDGEKLLDQVDANAKAFTLTGRSAAALKSVTSPNSPDVKALSDVQSYLNKARNAYLLSAKGTQTEGDAQRAWQEFSNSLDFSSPEGAKRSIERIRNELNTQKQSNEAYLKSRRIPVKETAPAAPAKTVVRTGTYNGRKVIQYSDGSVEYGN